MSGVPVTDPRTEAIEVMAQAHEDVFEHDDDLTARSDDLPAFLAERMLDALLSHPELVLGLVGEQVQGWKLLTMLDTEGETFLHMEHVDAVGDDYDGDEVLTECPVYVAKPVADLPTAEQVTNALAWGRDV